MTSELRTKNFFVGLIDNMKERRRQKHLKKGISPMDDSSPVMSSISHHPMPPTTEDLLSKFICFESSLEEDGLMQDKMSTYRTMTNLNHGSYGKPHPSTLRLRNFLVSELNHRQPRQFHRRLVPALVARAKTHACDYLNIQEAQRDGFAFCSTSQTLRRVLESVRFNPGDVVVTTDTLSPTLQASLEYMATVQKLIQWVQIETHAGSSDQSYFGEVERVIRKQITAGAVVKLAIFDHISVQPTFMFPIDRMCLFCRTLGIPTLVDGSNVAGALPRRFINVGRLVPTFYCVAFHKWCNSPPGLTGGIWVNKRDIQELFSEFIDVSSLTVQQQHGTSHCPLGECRQEENSSSCYSNNQCNSALPHIVTDVLFADCRAHEEQDTFEYENIAVLPHCLNIVMQNEKFLEFHSSFLREKSISILSQAWHLSETEIAMWNGLGEHQHSNNAAAVFSLPMLSVPLPTNQLLAISKFQPKASCHGRIKHKACSNKAERLGFAKDQLEEILWTKFGIEVLVFVWKEAILGLQLGIDRSIVLEDIIRLGDAVNCVIRDGLVQELLLITEVF